MSPVGLSAVPCPIARVPLFSLEAQCPWYGIRLRKQWDTAGPTGRQNVAFPMMHEPEDEFDWETECTRAYRAVVKEHGDDGIVRRAAINIACGRIQGLVADGSVMVPIQSIREAINAALNKADERDQKLTDKVLRTLAIGQPSFDFEGDPILDMTVVLGDGLRKVYRYVTGLDLDRMNDERRDSVSRAKRAYEDKWQPIYVAWSPILQRHATLGDAVEAGDLPSGLDNAA